MADELLGQLLRFVAYAIEEGQWMASGSSDPLKTTLPQAKKRARNIPAPVKDAVAKAAAAGDLAYTVGKIAAIRNRFNISGGALKPGSVEDSHALRAGRYWLAAKRQFSEESAGPFFSIVQDGTRMG
eukprot:6963567-Lingulodinium_polyedra.AAC.1